MKYPDTPKVKLIETIHGQKVTDNYRWLEDGSQDKVKKWVAAQNKLTDQSIPKSLQAKLHKELKQSFKFPDITAPYPSNGRYFWWERQPQEEQGVLYVREGLKGRKRELINQNKLTKAAGSVVTLDYWHPSPCGKYIAYGISKDGDELSALKVLEVETGKDTETVAENASYASVAWVSDGSGFYYTRHPVPGSVPEGEERYHQKAYYHELGTNSESDEEIFGEGRPKEDALGLSLSADGRFLVILACQDWERNDLYLYDTESKRTKDLIVGYDASFSISFHENQAFLSTNYKAPRKRILRAKAGDLSAKTKPEDWDELIPECEHKLEYFLMTKDQLIVVYLINAASQAVCFNLAGQEVGKLPLPEHATILDIEAWRGEAEFFYQYASFTSPGVINHYDPATDKITEFNRKGTTLNEADYQVRQEWFVSKDGTKVPMFVVHRKDIKLNGKNPTILSGYGGFNFSVTPFFLRAFEPWLKRGGVFASANIRGGGEFGKEWHMSGIKKNKQKSYDDFIAAAEHLIDRKYTSNTCLGIQGGSNGGLLVSVVAVQRPELFKAVEALVPLTDMVRFPNLLIAGRWTSEFGDPSKAEDLRNILKYSPYHNVREGREYPAFLFTTANNDTRVDPMHARKMAALLQSVNRKNPVLLYTDDSTGHVGSLTMSKFYQDYARLLAFFSEQLDLKI
jgi:prolyl oligopeptidase